MKFSIAKRDLINSVRLAASVAKSGAAVNDVFALVSAELADSRLDVRGGDGTMEINTPVSVSGERADGHAMFDGKKVMDYCETSGDEPGQGADGIGFAVEDDFLSINLGPKQRLKVRIQSGDYPKLDIAKSTEKAAAVELSVPASTLMRLISKTAFLIPREAGHRPALQGMLLELREGVLRSVTTDAQCLVLCEAPLPECKPPAERNQFIVPRIALDRAQELLREIGPEASVQLSLSDSGLDLRSGSKSLATKLIDAQFPDYERVLDKNFDKKIVVEKAELDKAMQRANTVFDQSHLGAKGCTFTIKGNALSLYSKNSNGEEVEEDLDVSTEGEGIALMLNTDFVRHGVGVFEEPQLQLLFTGPKEGVQMMSASGSTDLLYVMMPMSP